MVPLLPRSPPCSAARGGRFGAPAWEARAHKAGSHQSLRDPRAVDSEPYPAHMPSPCLPTIHLHRSAVADPWKSAQSVQLVEVRTPSETLARPLASLPAAQGHQSRRECYRRCLIAGFDSHCCPARDADHPSAMPAGFQREGREAGRARALPPLCPPGAASASEAVASASPSDAAAACLRLCPLRLWLAFVAGAELLWASPPDPVRAGNRWSRAQPSPSTTALGGSQLALP
mmetsp:Transcript_71069/g.169621  ORF Transcript_71069/g.169621 Transcript_71069/m.169621 type:complete len:231 (-) Transcript_71069:33-725(-)